jgi:hypothetical protein
MFNDSANAPSGCVLLFGLCATGGLAGLGSWGFKDLNETAKGGRPS